MAYEQKDMTFSLFPNKDKKSDKHPNLTGTAIIDGVAYFIDGWTNTDRNGKKFISGKLKPKQSRHEGREDSSGRNPSGGFGDGAFPDMDSEIPF